MKEDDPRFCRLAGFQKVWAIPGDREKTLKKNKKEQSYPKEREKTIRKKTRRHGRSDLTLGFAVFRFQVFRNHKGITHF
jgi:hypothetical protein